MKNVWTIFVALVIAVVLIAYMFFYQVRYDEIVVRTTFGAAEEGSIHDGSKPDQAGLYPKLFPPIQRIKKYSNRLHILEGQLQEVQTRDKYGVVITTYVAWRINDPLSFFRKMESENRAQGILKAKLNGLASLISEYGFSELRSQDKLEEIQVNGKKLLQDQMNDIEAGVEVVQFGIKGLELPEAVTQSVFDTMKQNREWLATKTRGEGESAAKEIESKADTIAQSILSFAQVQAGKIRDLGVQAATAQFARFTEEPELAILLIKLDAIRQGLGKKSKIVLSDTFFAPDSSLPFENKETPKK